MPSVIKLHDFVGQQPDKQGMRSADFAALLSAAGEDVEIHINSSGGTVTDGFHMANLLRSHGGKTVAVIEGDQQTSHDAERIRARIMSLFASSAGALRLRS